MFPLIIALHGTFMCKMFLKFAFLGTNASDWSHFTGFWTASTLSVPLWKKSKQSKYHLYPCFAKNTHHRCTLYRSRYIEEDQFRFFNFSSPFTGPKIPNELTDTINWTFWDFQNYLSRNNCTNWRTKNIQYISPVSPMTLTNYLPQMIKIKFHLVKAKITPVHSVNQSK